MLRGLTQDKVIERTGMDRRYYQRIEKGEGNPTLKMIEKLGTVLEVSADELLRGLWGPCAALASNGDTALLAGVPEGIA